MKIAVVDIQGFALSDQFIPKEMSIKLGNTQEHFIFKPPYPYHQISMKNRRILKVIENKLLGICYSYGEIDYEHIDSILYEFLFDVDCVYVRGHQKYDFLEERLSRMLPNYPKLVNIERIDEWHHHPPPNCKPTDTDNLCSHHMRGEGGEASYRCTEIIVENIFRWLVECLPKHY